MNILLINDSLNRTTISPFSKFIFFYIKVFCCKYTNKKRNFQIFLSGSYEKFKEEFINKALELKGSGYTFLVLEDNKLKIINTSNQDTPISYGFIPIMNVDVWEHAYYLKYNANRKSYIESYHCGYCGADYDKTINKKKIVLREFWSNPNGRNYKQFLDVIDEFIDLANSISEDEKNELKDKIKKVQDFKELINKLKDSNLSYTEKEIELLRSKG